MKRKYNAQKQTTFQEESVIVTELPPLKQENQSLQALLNLLDQASLLNMRELMLKRELIQENKKKITLSFKNFFFRPQKNKEIETTEENVRLISFAKLIDR